MMKIYKIIIVNLLLFASMALSAKDYKASLFGCKSDGITLNTGSIQYAIDYISENGGGTLHFYVGRYLTGSFELKSNVTIELHEGAILVASTFIYDYLEMDGTNALITAKGQENIGIKGQGVIEGQGALLQGSIQKQIEKGYMKEGNNSPLLVYFDGCSNISVEGIIMQDACGDIQSYSGCKKLSVKGVTVFSKIPVSKGIVVSGSDDVQLTDLYLDTTGAGLQVDAATKNITITNCINPKGKKY